MAKKKKLRQPATQPQSTTNDTSNKAPTKKETILKNRSNEDAGSKQSTARAKPVETVKKAEDVEKQEPPEQQARGHTSGQKDSGSKSGSDNTKAEGLKDKMEKSNTLYKKKIKDTRLIPRMREVGSIHMASFLF